MIKHKIAAMILVSLLCIVPQNASYDEAKIPSWASTGKIAHAGGGIEKTSYTNSVEALTKTLTDKKKVVELDFAFSKDGTLLCLHKWEDFGGEPLVTEEFTSLKIKKKYTPLTAEKAMQMLIENSVTYLVVDTKEDDVARVYKEIDRLCLEYDEQHQSKRGSTFRTKIIPQLYERDDFEKLKEIYDYKNWIFTVYKLEPSSNREYEVLARFCEKNKIQTMTIPKESLTDNIVKILQKHNLAIAVHTVNKTKEYNKYLKMGVNIIYTDFL